MGALGKDEAIKILQNLKQLFNDNKDFLVELDGRMGDGDLGLTMSKAFTAAADELSDTEESDIGKIFMKAGMIMAKAAPSTMGTLMATGFMRGGESGYGKKRDFRSRSGRLFPGFCGRYNGERKSQAGR